MGKFSKIFKHIESKDLRNKYKQKKAAKIQEEKRKEDTKKYVTSAMEQVKYNWRSVIDVGETIREGMTTSDVATISTAANPDEVLNDTPLDNADDFAPGAKGDDPDFYNGTVGTSIKSSGSGSGNNGGFDIGNHLAFDGAGSTDGARWMITQPIDTTRLNQINMRIITGNDSNGGETPDASGEGLSLYYKTPQMNDFIPIDYFPTLSFDGYRGGDIGYPNFDTNDLSGFVSNTIIPVGGGEPTLQDYSKYIPTYARGEGTQFLIYQFNSSGSGQDNFGIKNISYRRTTPIQVVAPLDDPEASSFIRGAEQGSTPKKRKKDVDDKLTASDEYTTFKFGNEFPGQEVRVGGEDPFKGAKIGDDVEPSPQGKDEVKKTFGDFNNQTTTVRGAPTTQPEAEPEPVAPSAQATMAPTTDDGDPIPVKPVGGKNSGVVQGADAATLDAQNAQDDAQEPETTEPETTEPEPEIDPEEFKASEEEKQGKTEEEIEEIEKEKYKAEEQKQVNKILDSLLNFAKQIDPLDMPIDLGINIAIGIIKLGKGINQVRSFLKKISGGRLGAGGLLGDPDIKLQDELYQKFFNNIEIMRSNLTGRITTQEYNSKQISDLANTLNVSRFIGDNFYGETGGSYGISDTRHEYVDDNIYVKDGKVYTNDQGLKSLANMDTGARSIDGIGKGYGQMIIPKDGSRPYFQFYDYNYHNLNSKDSGELPDGFLTAFGAQTAQVLRTFLPGRIFDDVINRIQGNLNTFGDNLKTRVGLDGWPPGIHGATLTDFKIPLDQLPEKTQEMIAAHPLSWTPERMANMSQEEITDQLYSVMQTEESFQNYLDFTTDITKMSTEPVNTVPYAVAMQEIDEVVEKYGNEEKAKYGKDGWDAFTSGLNRETSEFFAAERAAQEDLKTLESEEQKERDENDRIRGFEAQGAIYDRLVKPLYDSVRNTIKSGGTVSKATMDRLSRQYDKYKKQADKMEKEYFKIQSEIMDKYRDQREPIENIAYNQLNTLREPVKDSPTGQARYKIVNRDGDESSGADYTALDGTVYKGQNTYFDEYYNGQEQFYNQIDALYDPVADLQKYVDGNYVREAKIKEFGEKYKGNISGESWTPKKKGSGRRSDPKPDPRADFAGTGADAATFTFDGTPNKKKKQNEEVLLKYARPIPERKDLFERVRSKGFFNQNDIKPIFPENPPPKLDPKTGMHPQYGKKAKRYGKLDPISANSMPPTGDPEIDAVVNKQKTINKIKRMARNK